MAFPGLSQENQQTKTLQGIGATVILLYRRPVPLA
jgi:hypothetical protein